MALSATGNELWPPTPSIASPAIDGVVGDGQRTVAALVAHFKAKIDDVLFGDLKIVGDMLAANHFAPAAFVEGKFRVDQIAVIGDEPVDAVEGRSEEHTSELQSHSDLVCRLLLEKKKK